MASEIMWHRLSEEEKKKIETKAKSVMFDFGKAIEKLPKMSETSVDREEFERDEKNSVECDDNFRNLMFENAPKVEDECIVAEKGKWVEK
jgi:hypothetical protein